MKYKPPFFSFGSEIELYDMRFEMTVPLTCGECGGSLLREYVSVSHKSLCIDCWKQTAKNYSQEI